jgi:DNA-binding CsgD family transcriptional regulator
MGELLRAVGVSEAAERLYRALLVDPHRALVPDDPDMAEGLPLLLAELTRLELVDNVADGPVARDPQVAIAALVRRQQAELDEVTRAGATLSAEYAEGLLRAGRHRAAEIVNGEREVVRAMMNLVGSATREIMVLDAPPYVDQPASARAGGSAQDRGVPSRVVYAAAALEVPGRYDSIMASVRCREQARTLPEVPLKMIVVDGQRALLPLAVGTGGVRSVILVQPSLLASALAALFELLWQRAVPLAADPGDVPDELDEIDRALLVMLSSGLKDEAMARQLDISVRTLGRRVTRLMERLGATSRFQAGIQAARRGWL